MTEFDYKKLKKGIGVRVKIPDDVHNDNKQNIRPGIFIKFEKNYAVIQLCTSQSSNFDFATFFANNKRQYLRSIYTKNVPFNQIKDLWTDDKSKKLIKLNPEGKIMKKIINNKFKSSAVTIDTNEFVTFKTLEIKNKSLKNEININQKRIEEQDEQIKELKNNQKILVSENKLIKQQNETLKQEKSSKMENYTQESEFEKD